MLKCIFFVFSPIESVDLHFLAGSGDLLRMFLCYGKNVKFFREIFGCFQSCLQTYAVKSLNFTREIAQLHT